MQTLGRNMSIIPANPVFNVPFISMSANIGNITVKKNKSRLIHIVRDQSLGFCYF